MQKLSILITVWFIYSCLSLAATASEQLIIDKYSVFILNNSDQDSKAKFIYISEFDNYFKQLNTAISKRDAIKDAKQALEHSTVFLMGDANKSPNQPDLSAIDTYYHNKVYDLCPIKNLQAYNPSIYIDTHKLDYIRLKQTKNKPKEPTLKYDIRTKQYLLPDSYQAYGLNAYLYAKAWNTIMLPHCLKRVDIPDENKQTPVKTKHQLIGKIVFVLDNSPLLQPNKGYGMLPSIEEKIYKQRLLQALQISNPENAALSAIAHNEVYFLGTRKYSLGLSQKKQPIVRYRHLQRSKRPAAPRLLPDFTPQTNSGDREFLLLQQVCPSYEIEGQDFYDAKLISARQYYAEQWNKQMLTACRVKLEKTITTDRQRKQLDFAKANDTWLRNYPSSYSFKLKDQTNSPVKFMYIIVKNAVIIKAVDLNNKKSIPKYSLPPIFETLFSSIENSLLYERSSTVEVSYQAHYGYPTKLKITPPPNTDNFNVDYIISEVQFNKH